jgi:hypothetical protein
MSFCAFCYDPAKELLKCGQCRKRQFCSRECQRQDWKSHHKQFCKKTGGIGYDFEIKSCEKGLGVFALRPFKKNDMIMVERPLLKFPTGTLPKEDAVPGTAKKAVDALHPHGASFHKKVLINGISLYCASVVPGETGVFVTMSRVNHHCLGNSDHQYLQHRDAMILVASGDINEGEEVTFAYVINTPRIERNMRLTLYYEFLCSCSVCTDPGLEAKLSESRELDDAILRVGSTGQIDLAIRKGLRLIEIYDEIGECSWLYKRTYYDLFQVAITKKRYVKDGEKYIRKAYEAALAYTQDEHDPTVQRMKGLMQSPESHSSYLILEC